MPTMLPRTVEYRLHCASAGSRYALDATSSGLRPDVSLWSFFYKLCVHVFYVIYGGRGCVVYLERLAGAETSQWVRVMVRVRNRV